MVKNRSQKIRKEVNKNVLKIRRKFNILQTKKQSKALNIIIRYLDSIKIIIIVINKEEYKDLIRIPSSKIINNNDFGNQ